MEMKITFPGGQRVDAEFKGHTVRTDQPVKGGGENSAPAPFDYFLSSIGTCVGYYVMKFMASRDLPTDGLNIQLVTEKNPGEKLISRVRMTVQVPEGFPAKYERAIVNAANLCTVKKHLEEPPVFETIVQAGATTLV
jgi:ribosomal protein S12 methylthiotransferase accessory factor